MFLITILTVITLINSFASRIITFILSLISQDKSIEDISSQINELKKEQNVISMIDEFAKHAKLQRRINKLSDEKKSLVAGHLARISSLKYAALLLTYGINAVTLFFLLWTYKGEAVAQLPAEWLWPLPYIFSWFNNVPGCISIPSWIVISSTASKAITKIL